MKNVNNIFYLFLVFMLLSLNACESDFEESVCLKIGVFGGSQSVAPESYSVKAKWGDLFNAKVFDCGKGGAGYGLWQENNVFNQIKNNQIFDIYILWCSTNDLGQSISEDSEDNIKSQSGGLLLCLNTIKEMNLNAKILLFTSIPVSKKWHKTYLCEFVNKQIDFCEKYNIPYLNQFENSVLTILDFKMDELHLHVSGYMKLEPFQTEFLSKYISNKCWSR